MGLAVSAFAGEIRKSYPQLIVPKKSPKVYWIKIAKMLESASITKEDAFKVEPGFLDRSGLGAGNRHDRGYEGWGMACKGYSAGFPPWPGKGT